MNEYTDQKAKQKIEIPAHTIKRFHERFLGLDYKSNTNISVEIRDKLESLLGRSVPYARAQHNKIVWLTDWCDDLGRIHSVYMIVDYVIKRGRIVMRTVIDEELAERYYIAKGTWKKIWPNS